MDIYAVPSRRPVAVPRIRAHEANLNVNAAPTQPDDQFELQPVPTQAYQPAPLAVPQPVYWNRAPDAFVQGDNGMQRGDNSHVHVRHNQQAYARYEHQMQVHQPARLAEWDMRELPIYTTAIANTGLSERQFVALHNDAIDLRDIAYTKEIDWVNIIGCGWAYLCYPKNLYYNNKWSDDFMVAKINVMFNERNASFREQNIGVAARCVRVPGVKIYIELLSVPTRSPAQ